MIGGFLIDADHIIDQLWSISQNAPLVEQPPVGQRDGERSWITRYVRRRKLVRLPLVFHSYELLIAVVVLAAVTRTPFLAGLVVGYAMHILLDFLRHRHEFRSPFFYLILFRLTRGFRRDRLIKPEFL